jgi:excisionase family DNA binding protein
MQAYAKHSQRFSGPSPSVGDVGLPDRGSQPAGLSVAPPAQPVYFNPRDAAAYLTISPRTLWQETKVRRINAARVGRRLIYPRAELDRFMAVRLALAS